MVTQEAHLFHDTIRANLAYAEPDATEEEMVAALKAAQVWPLVSSLPEGLDTVVGDRGPPALRRREAAPRPRAPAAQGPGPRRARRGHRPPRQRVRGRPSSGRSTRPSTGRTALVIAHRLSTVRGRRPDPRGRRRPHRRARHATASSWLAAACTHDLYTHPVRRPGPSERSSPSRRARRAQASSSSQMRTFLGGRAAARRARRLRASRYSRRAPNHTSTKPAHHRAPPLERVGLVRAEVRCPVRSSAVGRGGCRAVGQSAPPRARRRPRAAAVPTCRLRPRARLMLASWPGGQVLPSDGSDAAQPAGHRHRRRAGAGSDVRQGLGGLRRSAPSRGRRARCAPVRSRKGTEHLVAVGALERTVADQQRLVRGIPARAR